MRTTMIDVKFDEECKGNPANAENYRKIIKLLVKINDVEKYLVHQ